MKLFVFCLVVVATTTIGAAARIETAAKTTKSQETSDTIHDTKSNTSYSPHFENETALVEERSTLEIFEKLFVDLLSYEDNTLQDPDVESGRTFGVKRLQFMLMPMMYKMGVMMTLLVVLTVISLKGLAIGVILLVLKIGAIFGKFYAHNSSHGWAAQPQPVHVHLHNSGGPSPHYHQPHGGWEPAYNSYGEPQQYY